MITIIRTVCCVPCVATDPDLGSDDLAEAVQPLLTGPQQQDLLHCGEHRGGEGIGSPTGYTLYVHAQVQSQ